LFVTLPALPPFLLDDIFFRKASLELGVKLQPPEKKVRS